MNTTEDFENAPIGATATSPNGDIALNTGRFAFDWAVYNSSGGFHALLRSDELKGFTIDPTHPAPTTAREALDLAWNLAHPLKEGQVIPEGDVFLSGSRDHFTCEKAYRDAPVGPSGANWFRTLDPLPDPEPDWLNAPAVLATCGCRGIELWHPRNEKDGMWVSASGEQVLWSTLRDVTPLYPEGKKA